MSQKQRVNIECGSPSRIMPNLPVVVPSVGPGPPAAGVPHGCARNGILKAIPPYSAANAIPTAAANSATAARKRLFPFTLCSFPK